MVSLFYRVKDPRLELANKTESLLINLCRQSIITLSLEDKLFQQSIHLMLHFMEWVTFMGHYLKILVINDWKNKERAIYTLFRPLYLIILWLENDDFIWKTSISLQLTLFGD